MTASLALCETSPFSRPFFIPTVFVIDDDISIRESLADLINYAGWQVETFASAQEFLAPPGDLDAWLSRARRRPA